MHNRAIRTVLAAVVALAVPLTVAACGGRRQRGAAAPTRAPTSRRSRSAPRASPRRRSSASSTRQALKAKGYKVTLKPNIGQTEIADKALTSGKIDMYPEYTGTTLSVVAQREDQAQERRGRVRGGQEVLRGPRADADRGDAVLRLRRRGGEEGLRRQQGAQGAPRPQEALGQRRQARRGAGVRHARGGPARPEETLRAEQPEVHAAPDRAPVQGARRGQGQPHRGVHHRRRAGQRQVHRPGGPAEGVRVPERRDGASAEAREGPRLRVHATPSTA